MGNHYQAPQLAIWKQAIYVDFSHSVSMVVKYWGAELPKESSIPLKKFLYLCICPNPFFFAVVLEVNSLNGREGNKLICYTGNGLCLPK